MTIPATPTTRPPDEELLIQEAIRQRHSKRAGRSLAGALAIAVFFVAVGYLLDFHPGVIDGNVPFPPDFLQPVLMVLGVVAFLVAALLVAGAVSGASPGAPWGDAVPGDCPVCGNAALREGEAVVRLPDGLIAGVVTLCATPGCPHAAAAAPGATVAAPRAAVAAPDREAGR